MHIYSFAPSIARGRLTYEGDFMKVKKKCISSLKRCFILSLCVVIGLVVSLQGFCASTLNYPLSTDIEFMSSWGEDNVYMQGNDWWGKFSPVSASTSFDCTLQCASGSYDFLPEFDSNSSYSLFVKTAWTIPNTTYNTISPDSFASKSYLMVTMRNGSNVRVTPTISYTKWDGGTGYNVRYTYQFPEGAKSIYSVSFGCSFSRSVPTSIPMYLTVYPLQLTTTTGTDKITSAIGNDTPNTSTVDDYNKAESELMGGVQGGLDDINSQWNNINGDLLQYQGAFFAFRSFFNKLTDLPFVSVVVTLSVSVGSFALLLGAVNTIFKNRGD